MAVKESMLKVMKQDGNHQVWTLLISMGRVVIKELFVGVIDQNCHCDGITACQTKPFFDKRNMMGQ